MVNKRTKRTPTRVTRTVSDWDQATTVGNDEGSDDIDLSMTLSGGIVLLPQSLRNATPVVKDGAAQLQRLVGLRQKLLDQIAEVIGQMRDDGASWGVIAYSTGVTSDGARRRWGMAE